MLKLNLSKFLFFPLLFLFLPAFYIPIGYNTPLYLILILMFSLFVIIFRPISLISRLRLLYYKTPFKYYVYFIIWVFLSLSCLLLLNKISFLKYLISVFIVLIPYLILYCIYPMYVLKYIEFKSIYKFLAVGFFLVFIWGIITFIGILFDVGFLKILLTFFSNRQFLVTGNGMYDLRARSTFFEPGFYAYFINLNLPLFYNIHKSKYQILKNKYCNFIIKHSLYPLAIINIILSFSAMGYAFMFIILVYIYFKELLPKLKKTKFLIRFCILSFVIIGAVPFYIHTYSQNNNVAFKRVQNALYVLYSGNIIALYETDASLFTRIVSYTNEFILFQHNPILGVGLEQAKYKMPDLFEVSPLPLTFENRHFLYQSYLTKKLVFNRNLLCDSLAETGLLGCIFLYLFMIKTWLINKKLEKYDFGIDKEFTKILNDILFLLIVFSFYEIGIIGLSYHFFILAISNEIILRRKMRICNKYYHINTKGRL